MLRGFFYTLVIAPSESPRKYYNALPFLWRIGMVTHMFYRPDGSNAQNRINSITAFLKLIGENEGVTFCFERSPSTDGRTVWLGDISPSDDDFELLALGHGIHEMMHVLHSNLPASIDRLTSPLAKLLFNVLEDVRIDTLGMQRFAGYQLWREALSEHLIKKGRLRALSNPETMPEHELFSLWLLSALYLPLKFRWARQAFTGLDAQIRGILGNELGNAILQIARQIAVAQSADDVIDLVNRILRIIRSAHNNAKQHQLKKCMSRSSSATAQITFLDRLIKFRRSPSSATESASTATLTHSAQAPCSAIFHSNHQIKVCDWSKNVLNSGMQIDVAEYVKAFDQVHQDFLHTRDKLRELLSGDFEESDRPCCEASEISTNFMERLAQNDPRIFSAESETKELDTSVLILLDRSGSMGIETLTGAKAGVAALYCVLKNLENLDVSIALFPGPGCNTVARVQTQGFSTSNILNTMAAVSAFGSTPVLEAMTWAKQELACSPRRNKLMLLITDGVFPANYCSDAEPELNRAGIELAVLNIDTNNDGLAKNMQTITDIGQFQPALVRLLKNSSLLSG